LLIQMDKQKLASMLIEAQQTAKPLPASFRQDFTLEEAYEIQALVRDEKIRQGRRVIGKKIGFTSKGMRRQFQVDRPDYGNLFDDQIFTQGTKIDTSRFIVPRAEGEIAFILERDLRGPGVTAADVLRATYGVMACIEFVDSRWDFPFSIVDSIADNGGCGGFLLGSRLVRLEGLDLRYIAMFVEKNGELISSGAGVEVLGDPLNSVAWLANALSVHGNELKAGDIILSGAITSSVPVAKGDLVNVSFSTLGNISLCFA